MMKLRHKPQLLMDDFDVHLILLIVPSKPRLVQNQLCLILLTLPLVNQT